MALKKLRSVVHEDEGGRSSTAGCELRAVADPRYHPGCPWHHIPSHWKFPCRCPC